MERRELVCQSGGEAPLEDGEAPGSRKVSHLGSFGRGGTAQIPSMATVALGRLGECEPGRGRCECPAGPP
jgi:hypothetical protein